MSILRPKAAQIHSVLWQALTYILKFLLQSHTIVGKTLLANQCISECIRINGGEGKRQIILTCTDIILDCRVFSVFLWVAWKSSRFVYYSGVIPVLRSISHQILKDSVHRATLSWKNGSSERWPRGMHTWNDQEQSTLHQSTNRENDTPELQSKCKWQWKVYNVQSVAKTMDAQYIDYQPILLFVKCIW